MSVLKAIRSSIANFIAPACERNPVQMVVDNAKHLTHPQAPAHVLSQAERREDKQLLTGKFYVIDLARMNSTRCRDAIASLGCWSALARGFSEYERVIGQNHLSDEKLNALLDEFHAWNAVVDAGGAMGEDAVLAAVAKMAVVQPSKGNNDTDAILARVKRISIEEVRADRKVKADAKTEKRIELIDGFCATLWGCMGGDADHYSMSSAKALDKAIQTLEWVAGWDSNNPAEQAAELILIEDDIKTIKQLAKLEKHNEEEYVEGVMASDTLNRNIDGLDKGRRYGESGKGSPSYEPEPMDKALADLEEQRPARRRIRREA